MPSHHPFLKPSTPLAGRRRGTVLSTGSGNHADLLHDPQHVYAGPVLDDLAAGQANNVDTTHGEALAGRRDALEIPLMRGTVDIPPCHAVAFSEHIFDRHLAIGERVEEQLRKLALPGRAGGKSAGAEGIDLGGPEESTLTPDV